MSFTLGALTQIFGWPEDIGVNAVLSNLFYISAVLAVADGILRRSDKRFGLLKATLLLILFSCLIWYFFYVDRNLLMRIYIQNFGAGLILLVTALGLRELASGRFIDKALFWTLLGFSIQFFPRTILTVETYMPGDPSLFGESLFWRTLQFSLAVLGAGFAFVILAAAITDVIDDIRHERDLDRLTGILNRRGFEDQADHLIGLSNGPMAMVVCDLDYFKRINDSFGHATGDDVLATFGSVLRRTVRNGDLVGRIGGEEFAILLPNANAREAQGLAERLHKEIATSVFPLPAGAEKVTASIGVTVSSGVEDRASLLERADTALYKAKKSGRNRTVFSTEGSIDKSPPSAEVKSFALRSP